MWIIALEVVDTFGDLKKPEAAIGTGPFLLERYEPNVKMVFKRNPDYFRIGQPWVDGVDWLVLEEPSSRLAMYRIGQLDLLGVRQQDVQALKKSHPHLIYQDFLVSNVSNIWMRVDQSPFNDVRVRRAISLAIDRQGLIDAVALRGAPTTVIPPGLAEWSLPIDQLGEGAKYYQYSPQEARRLQTEAGLPQGFKTLLHTTTGFGPDLVDAAQLVQWYLKDVGIEAELKLQEYGAYFATAIQGKFEGMALGPVAPAWDPDFMLSRYIPDSPRNNGHVNDPRLTAMVQAQRRTQDLEARKKIIFSNNSPPPLMVTMTPFGDMAPQSKGTCILQKYIECLHSRLSAFPPTSTLYNIYIYRSCIGHELC